MKLPLHTENNNILYKILCIIRMYTCNGKKSQVFAVGNF